MRWLLTNDPDDGEDIHYPSIRSQQTLGQWMWSHLKYLMTYKHILTLYILHIFVWEYMTMYLYIYLFSYIYIFFFNIVLWHQCKKCTIFHFPLLLFKFHHHAGLILVLWHFLETIYLPFSLSLTFHYLITCWKTPWFLPEALERGYVLPSPFPLLEIQIIGFPILIVTIYMLQEL